MLISIITLNYKKPELTIACLRSVYRQFVKEFKENIIEFIIVDNASMDNSIRLLKEEISFNKYVNVQLIENEKNSGFGKGCNIGASEAEGEYLLFLNNDTLVEDRGFLRMSEFLSKHKQISILGGQMQNKDGTLQASSGNFYTLRNVFLLLMGLQRFGIVDKKITKIQKVDWVKGGLLMIRKSVFEKLGGFDEKIFMYIEDMELCYRAKLQGDVTFFYPNIKVIHEEHGSANKTFAIIHIYKNLLYFYKKHRTKGEYLILKFLLTIKALFLLGGGYLLNNKYFRETYKFALKEIY